MVAPRLFRGASGTFRERAVAGHLPLDRQGQRKISVCRATYLTYRFCCRRNWRVSSDNEFLHGNYKLLPEWDLQFTPSFKSLSARHECHLLAILRSRQRASAEHPRCIKKRGSSLAPSCEGRLKYCKSAYIDAIDANLLPSHFDLI